MGSERGVIVPAEAWRLSKLHPDPPGLEFVTGNNRQRLRAVAKLVFVMCEGKRGAEFFLGSHLLARLVGCSQRAALDRLKQLDAQGIISRKWPGGLCRRDEQGREYAGGELVRRASEYVFRGLPACGCTS